MKKFCRVFTVLIIVFSVSTVVAQNIQIGPIAGLNLASVNIDITDGQDINTSFRAGFAVGGSFYLAFSPNIGLQFEPAYMQKGSKAEVKFIDSGDNIKIDETLKANYMDIPVLFKASFGQGSIKPYVLAGADIALKMGDTKVKMDKVIINGLDVTSLFTSDELEDE